MNSDAAVSDAVESISETLPNNKTVIIAVVAVTTGVIVTIVASKLQGKIKAKLADMREKAAESENK